MCTFIPIVGLSWEHSWIFILSLSKKSLSHKLPGGHSHWKGVWGCAAVMTPFFQASRRSLAYQFTVNGPLLRPPFSIFRKFLDFQPCFGQNSSSLGPIFWNPCGTHPPKKSWVPPRAQTCTQSYVKSNCIASVPLGLMSQNWSSTLENGLNRFCKKKKKKKAFFLLIEPIFSLEAIIFRCKNPHNFLKFCRIGRSLKTLEGTLCKALHIFFLFSCLCCQHTGTGDSGEVHTHNLQIIPWPFSLWCFPTCHTQLQRGQRTHGKIINIKIINNNNSKNNKNIYSRIYM